MNLSFFSSAYAAVPSKSINVQELIAAICSGQWKDRVQDYRGAVLLESEERAKALKRALPAVTMAGKFTQRNEESLAAYSHVICADIDKVGTERAKEIRNLVRNDPYVLGGFISPSGNGVKILFKVTTSETQHRAAWTAARDHLLNNYKTLLSIADLDDDVDLPRLCFISWDEGAFYQPTALSLLVNIGPPSRLSSNKSNSEENTCGSALDSLVPIADDFDLSDAHDAVNHLDPDMSYSEWLDVAASLRHQFPNEPDSDKAYQIFDEWSQKGEKYVGLEETTALWKSLKSTPRMGAPRTARSIIQKAKAAGWVPGRNRIDKIRGWLRAQRTKEELIAEGATRIAQSKPSQAILSELCELLLYRLKECGHTVSIRVIREQVKEAFTAACKAKPIPLPAWGASLVFIRAENKFYDTARMGIGLVPDAVDHSFKKFMPDADIAPHEYLLVRCNLPQVDAKAYDPGKPSLFTDEVGRKCANTYIRSYAAPDFFHAKEAGALLMRHLALLISEPKHQQTLIDFLAYIVQCPGEKVLWAPIILGTQGCGKSTIAVLAEKILGQTNVRRLEAGSTLASQFNGFSAGHQLVVFDETRIVGSNPREMLERLKPLIVDTHVDVNRKYENQEAVRNVTNYILFTNHADALPLDQNERRFFVLRSPLRTKADVQVPEIETHFEELYAFIDENPGAFRAFLEMWEISESFKPKSHAPDTIYKAEMERAAESPIKAAVRSCIEESDNPSLKSELFAFDDLFRCVGADNHLRLNVQNVSKMLDELGFLKIGRFNIHREKRVLWGKADSPYIKSPDVAVSEFKQRLALHEHMHLFS